MAWLTALIKAILDWVTGEIKKDTKASDADSVPKDLKNKWRERIEEQEKKVKPKSAEEVRLSKRKTQSQQENENSSID